MEIVNIPVQTVQPNQDVLFSNTVIPGSNCMIHRGGSGLITLRGLTNS